MSFRDQDLLDAVNVGLARDSARRENDETLNAFGAQLEVLTPRERTILYQVAKGRLNKQMAGDMGITETINLACKTRQVLAALPAHAG